VVVEAAVAAVVEVVAAPVFGNLDGILAARRAAVAVGSSRVALLYIDRVRMLVFVGGVDVQGNPPEAAKVCGHNPIWVHNTVSTFCARR
jgi:hypothetical protein